MIEGSQNTSDSTKLIRALIFCITVVFCLHLINVLLGKPSYNFDRLVHFDHEANLPTWFSSMLWAIGAVVAYQCAKRADMKFEQRLWIAMALVLLILSLDEVAMLHEHVFGMMIGKIIRKFTGSREWLKWPVIASPLILFVIIYFSVGLKKCLVGSKRCGVFLVLGVITLIISACVLEIVHYYFSESSNLLLEIEVILEELGEMIGVFLIICGLLAHRKVLANRYETSGNMTKG